MTMAKVVLIAFFIVVALFGIYYMIYSHVVNKRLKESQEKDFEEAADQLKLPSLKTVLSIIMTIVVVVYITKLNNNIDNLNNEIDNMTYNVSVLQGQISNLNGNIADLDYMIRKTNSNIEKVSLDMGTLNTENNTAPVTIEATLKTISPNTSVKIYIDNKAYEMSVKTKAIYSVTVDMPVFEDETMKFDELIFEITDGDGKTTTETIDINDCEDYEQIDSFVYNYFAMPAYYADIEQVWDFDKNTIRVIAKDGILEIKEAAFDGDEIKDAKLVFAVDNVVVEEIDVTKYLYKGDFNFDKTFEINTDQTLSIRLEATHSLGYKSVEFLEGYSGDGSVIAYLVNTFEWYDSEDKIIE